MRHSPTAFVGEHTHARPRTRAPTRARAHAHAHRLMKALIKERDFLARAAAATAAAETEPSEPETALLTHNLPHLRAVIACLAQADCEVSSIGRRYSFDDHSADGVTVDVVCSAAAKPDLWICVRAARGLASASCWEETSGLWQRTKDLLAAAQLRTACGTPVFVSYFFPFGVSDWLSAELRSQGLSIWPSRPDPPARIGNECVNLDCTTLVALCSQATFLS